jgi:hypothetical protein
MHKGKKTFAAAFLLLIPILVLLGDALFTDKVLAPVDILLSYPLWEEEYAGVSAQNPLLSDQVFMGYPWLAIAKREIQTSGSIPLWNPYTLTGQPLVANAQSALAYPGNLLLFFFEPDRVVVLRALFNLFIAGFFTYLLCIELGIGFTGSLLAGGAFMLCGPIIVWLGHSVSNVLAVFPVQMWAVEKYIRSRQRMRWLGVLGFAVALSLLGGHPETTFHAGLLMGVYYLARLFQENFNGKERTLSLFGAAGAAILALLISGVQLVPFLELLAQSSTLQTGRSMGGQNWLYSPDWMPNIATLVTAWIPQFFGSPVRRNYTWPFPIFQNYNEQSFYLGMIPLALGAAAIFALTKRRKIALLAVLGLVCLAIAWRLPGFEIFNHVPPLSLMLNKRFKMFFPFFFALLAGFGVDALTSGDRKISTHARISAALMLSAGVGMYAFLFVMGKFSAVPAQPFLHHLVIRVFNLNNPHVLIPAVCALLALLFLGCAVLFSTPARLVKPVLLVFAIIELVAVAWGYNPAVAPDLSFPETATIRKLQSEAQPFRVISRRIFPENTGILYQIAQVEGYDLPIVRRYSDLYYAQGGVGSDYRQMWSADWPLVDWLNVKYVFSAEEIHLSKYTLVDQGPGFYLYQNQHALPRAYMVYQYTVMADEQALSTMVSGDFEFANNVLLDRELPAEARQGIRGGTAKSQVRITDYRAENATITVETEKPGLLVMSDLWFPGWKARLDGAETGIYRANYTYRAVIVPAGAHTILFSYQPASFATAIFMTILGLAIFIILLALPVLGWKRQKQGGPG